MCVRGSIQELSHQSEGGVSTLHDNIHSADHVEDATVLLLKPVICANLIQATVIADSQA